MTLRRRVTTVLIGATIALTGTGTALAGTALASPGTPMTVQHHGCTHTSSGSCIRGGEFCPQSSYGHSGWDAYGRRYVCKGDHTHPHWEIP